MENEKISVIVPVYKVEKYLDRCVESIVNQTYKNLEIILVDDGSPDNCPKMCDEWAKKDSRIKVVHKQNGGLSDARNSGIDTASGEYLCFIDSDDYIDINFVEVLFKNLADTESDMSICAFRKVYEDKINNGGKQTDIINVYQNEEIINFFLCKDLLEKITACTKLYKKEIFDNLRFDVGRIYEDEFIAHKIYSKCKKIVTTTAKLYNYLMREGSITNKPRYDERSLDGIYAIENRYNYFKNTKFENIALNQLLKNISYAYSIAKYSGKDKLILTKIRKMFNNYYKQNKNKTLKQYLFKYCPSLFCFLARMKRKLKSN